MGTVLWSNRLAGGKVESAQEDLIALYRHVGKLDVLCKKLGLIKFSSICDNTDMLVNLDQLEMPAAMESTDELMASQGVWIDAKEALALLEKLLAHIKAEKTRFGLLKNAHDEVVEELERTIPFARDSLGKGAKLNFSAVM